MSGAWIPPAAALAAGLAGSAHCAAMCGGIAGAAGAGFAAAAARPLAAACAFNLARLLSYAAVGALLAATLGSLVASTPIAMLALGARLIAALVLAALALRLATGWDVLGTERLGAFAWQRLRPAVRRTARLPMALRPAALGALWGFMPCGLVYSVLLVAAATGRPLAAAATMAAFGLGTMPAMLSVTIGGSGLGRLLRRPSARRTAAALVLATAIWTLAAALMHPPGEHAHAAERWTQQGHTH